MTKVLVVATSRKTRGGITSVVKAHETGWQWKEYHCRWIETHIDRGVVWKLVYLLKGLFEFVVLLPWCRIVHIHTSEPPSAMRKCLFMALAKLACKKVIVHFHAFSPDTTINGKYKNVYRYLFTKADAVIVLSETWKKYVTAAFDLNGKVRVVYNPCTAKAYPRAYKKKKQILYAGTVNARKGYKDMIEAFAKVAGNFPDWQIVFAGNGEVEQGRALAARLGIAEQTEFLGWVSGEAKDKAFKEASVSCLPSYAEGFPMAVLDAWAYGLPVMTTPVGGIPDVAQDGVNMLLFAPGDVNALATQMERMMSDADLRDRISLKSTELSETIFNVNNVNAKIRRIYAELAE